MPGEILERRDPRKLRSHERNQSVYGVEKLDQSFIDDFDEEMGLINPIVILPNGTILSGHRSREAAIARGWKEVLCIVRPDLDVQPNKQGLALLRANKHRIKSGDVLAREASYLAELNRGAASERQKSTQFQTAGVTSSSPQDGRKGPTRKKVADELGIGEQKAENAIVVGDRIRAAEKAGDKATAERIAKVAREKSVNAAAKLVKEESKPEMSDRAKEIKAIAERFDHFERAWCPAIQNLAIDVEKVLYCGRKSSMNPNLVSRFMGSIWECLMPHRPVLCEECHADDNSCKACRGRGFKNRAK